MLVAHEERQWVDPRHESIIWPTVSNAEVHSLVPYSVLYNGALPTENRSILQIDDRGFSMETINRCYSRFTPSSLHQGTG